MMDKLQMLAALIVGLAGCANLAYAQCKDKTDCTVVEQDPYSYSCYRADIRDLCCATCQKFYTEIAGCEYGDRASWCKNETYPTTCYYNGDACCGTCANYADPNAPAGCEYGDKSTWCKEPDRTYPLTCYYNEDLCCGTCLPLKNTSLPGCEYGDRDPDCRVYVADDVKVCDVEGNKDICCASCDIPSGPAVGAIDASMKHSIEIRVIVDKFAFNEWKSRLPGTLTEAEMKTETGRQLDQYISAVFQGVNEIFKELVSEGISLDVRILGGINYITTETVAKEVTTGSGTLSVDTVLNDLDLWLETNNYPIVDHTMLFTGLDIVDSAGGSQILGAAKVGAMCSSLSLSVVEANPNGNAVLTMAHELGHSLSAEHDGEPGENNCSPDKHFIMDASKEHNSTDNFRFSSCSVNYFRNKLLSLYSSTGGNCLSAANTQAPAVSSQPLGKVFSPDEMCRRTVGEQSYVCRGFYGGAVDDIAYNTICTAIWCSVPGSTTCTSVVAADGFTCGKDKECSLGFCKPSSTPHAVTDICPVGDYPSYVTMTYKNAEKTCSEIVTSYNGACYSSYYYRRCCASCDAVKTNVAGCPATRVCRHSCLRSLLGHLQS